MLRNDFLTSPTGSPRQLELKPEINSDDLWLAKYKSKSSKKRGKSLTAKSSPRLVPQDTRVLSSSSIDSPLTRLQSSVTQLTGFSPLNPTSSLHDEFHALSPPTNQSPLVTDSDYHNPDSSRLLIRGAAARPTAHTPLASVISAESSTDTRLEPSYEDIRPLLFQQAFIDSINGAKFDDTQIYVFSARSNMGNAHRPKVVNARRAFLSAACPRFDDICPVTLVRSVADIKRKTSRTQYGYDADSDLEETEEEIVDEDRSTQDAASSPTVPQSRGVATSPMVSKAPEYKLTPAPTPRNAVLNFADGDAVSPEVESESALSEILQDIQQEGSSRQTPARPSLSLQMNSTPSWRPSSRQRDFTPREVSIDIPPTSDSRTEESDRTAVEGPATLTGDVTLFVPDSAHKTWQSLLLYIYNDFIQFAPLKSQCVQAVENQTAGPSCSPKSMYRLATKLGLETVKRKAFTAIEQALSKENIVTELFSDFTWRYPEILAMQTDIFYKYSTEHIVQAAMSETFQEIAYGQMPHSSIVLSSLFKRFVSATSQVGTSR